MWGGGGDDFGGQGGGFFSGAAPGFGNSPAPSGDKPKGRRATTIVPVTIKKLMECQEDKYRLGDIEVDMVTVVGLVTNVENSTTKMTLHLDDQTGVAECMSYVGTTETADGGNPEIPILPIEGTYARVVGGLRTTKGQKYILIFRLFPLTDLNEMTAHMLEVIQIPMKLKKVKDAISLRTGVGMNNANPNNPVPNSIILNNTGGGNNTGGFNTKQNQVLQIIKQCKSDSGIHKEEICRNLKGKMTPKEIAAIIEELSNEGHIFSTVDDDHFQCTD